MRRLLVCALALAALAGSSSAASLNLTYSIAPAGSLWAYNMTLSVDTSVSSWAPGMGWSWITFGDVPNNGTSPLADFSLTSAPPAPYASLSFSSGGHNGPSWIFDGASNIAYWTPTSAADTISWSGTSSFHATPGSLQFSELLTQSGATNDNFKNMIQSAVPEPASLLVLGGLVPIFLRKRRARK